MRKYLLISHGKMAEGLRDTLKIFVGNVDDFSSICAYSDDCDPKEELKKFWDSVKDEQVLIFSDIFAGSVNQLVTPYLGRENTYIYAGMNLPMLIQAFCVPEDEIAGKKEEITEAGRKGCVCMNTYQMEGNEDDE